MTESLDRLKAALADRYRIERELGQGGMATVYLAEDLKHKRQVAVKVLRPELAAVLGGERFVQEITTTASLQHPHILPLFDSGTADGFLFYVMPFIDGETLRDKLDRETQLGVEEAVRITTEVADALDYAHRQGVIHRDIKPENILLHDGRPMVADFGIALAVSAAAGGRMTETGLSLGTPHYMSPEQATAEKEITARSDIYSLGSVLYEMLTGHPPHVGSSAQQIILKIVTEEAAPVTEERKAVPPNIAAAVAKSVERLPADRFVTAAQFAEALANPSFATTGSPSTPGFTPPISRPRQILPWALVAGLAVALAWLLFRPSPAGPVSRFEISVEEQIEQLEYDSPVISPDGTTILYPAPTAQLYRRDRDDLTPKLIPDTQNAWSPFFSPDGLMVGFATGLPGDLRVIELSGGASVTLVTDSVYGFGGSWGPDGWIYFIGGELNALMRVRAEGGAPELVARPDSDRSITRFMSPQVLPDGKGVVVTIFRHGGSADVGVVEVATGELTVLARGLKAQYAPSGHLVIGQDDGSLMAAPFDPKRRRLLGPAVTLSDSPRVVRGTVSFSLSRTGTLLYDATPSTAMTIVRVTRDGTEQVVDPDLVGTFGSVAVSPNGKQLVVMVLTKGAWELWVKTLDTGPLTRLAFGGLGSFRGVWAHDGGTILFLSDQEDIVDQPYEIASDGSSRAQRLWDSSRPVNEILQSRDGQWIIYRAGSGGGRDLLGFRPGVDSAHTPLQAESFEEYAAALSPDGRWLAYGSDESGRSEVYVRPFPNVGSARMQISRGGGAEPTWSRSGRELFYRDANADLVSVEMGRGPMIEVIRRRVLIPGAARFRAAPIYRGFDVAPDDQSFYFVRDNAQGRLRFVVVDNFFEELKAKVPR